MPRRCLSWGESRGCGTLLVYRQLWQAVTRVIQSHLPSRTRPHDWETQIVLRAQFDPQPQQCMRVSECELKYSFKAFDLKQNRCLGVVFLLKLTLLVFCLTMMLLIIKVTTHLVKRSMRSSVAVGELSLPPQNNQKQCSNDNMRKNPDYRIGIMGSIWNSISELDSYLLFRLKLCWPLLLPVGSFLNMNMSHCVCFFHAHKINEKKNVAYWRSEGCM